MSPLTVTLIILGVLATFTFGGWLLIAVFVPPLHFLWRKATGG